MKLKVYTASYPYGFSESFLTNELEVLKMEIGSIEILPFKKNGTIQQAFDAGFPVREVVRKPQKLKVNDFFVLLQILLKEFLHTNRKSFFFKKIKRHYVILRNALFLSKQMEQDGLDKEALHYSFWMNEWALALAILKKRKKINQFVFRVNGYDIWDERHEGNYLPFRYFNYSQTSKVFALSKTSVAYLKKFNFFPNKIELAYFGTKELGVKKEGEKKQFTIFSCSSAIPLKRLDKIALVLTKVKHPVTWIHHGEGATIQRVEEIIADNGAHISFELSRKKEDYMEVLSLMQNSSPDLFINLSETEGLPVTLIEAMSFGIPLLANKVGSCHELFEENVGVLVEKEATVNEIAVQINELISGTKVSPTTQEVKAHWRNGFSAEVNYGKFVTALKNIAD